MGEFRVIEFAIQKCDDLSQVRLVARALYAEASRLCSVQGPREATCDYCSRPPASRTRASTTRWSTSWANRLPSPAPSAFPPRRTGTPRPARLRHGGSSADMNPRRPCASWVGSRWACWSSLRCPASSKSVWVPLVQETDVLLVNGGDPLYLCYWMRQSGLADLLPSLRETVYVGLSAGSMVMTPSIGQDFVGWTPPTGGDETLGLVDFSIFPHLDNQDLPDNTMANAEKWAAGMTVPAYVIDDETAIKVVDGAVEVVSEGHWKLFTP